MTARTHDVAALALLVTAVIVVPPGKMTVATALTAFVANQLGGIAPDIDQPTAPLWRNLPVGKYLGKVFAALVGGHRFICHSLIGLVLFGIVSRLFLIFIQPLMPPVDVTFVWFAFLLGVLSHLFMDMLTKEGVPLLLPLPFKFGFPPLRAWRVTTGKGVELFIILPAITLFTIWLCSTHYSVLTNVIANNLVK